jgi:hypothetical protein
MTAPMKPRLTTRVLQDCAATFANRESHCNEPSLYGVTDGKAVGTYLEHKFLDYLSERFIFSRSSSAKGVDLPGLQVDIKVTSVRQPQSSCPYSSARQKIFGLGYSLLVFVYEKTDNRTQRTAKLNIQHVVFVDAKLTGDFQMTRGLRAILENSGNKEDLMAFMQDRNLPIDEIEADKIAEEILATPPELGYLTISNALQWRLQYGRVIEKAGTVEGILQLR